MVGIETLWALPSYIDLHGQIIPLVIYALLIGLYGVFVLFFYKSISKRNLFNYKVDGYGKKHKAMGATKYLLKYIILFPVFTFVWFSVLALVMFFLSKSQSTALILLLSVAVIGGARIAAYIREQAAEEIAKILPLAVLGVFLVDPSFFSLEATLTKMSEVGNLLPLLVNYFFFMIVLEFGLRILYEIKRKLR